MVQRTLNICSKNIAAKEGAAHRNINKQGFNITVLCTSIQTWFFTTNILRPRLPKQSDLSAAPLWQVDGQV